MRDNARKQWTCQITNDDWFTKQDHSIRSKKWEILNTLSGEHSRRHKTQKFWQHRVAWIGKVMPTCTSAISDATSQL